MQQVQVAQAKAHFSALLALVESGEEVVISRRGKAVARLVPEPRNRRKAADAFREVWELGGFDLAAVPELPMDKQKIDLD